MKCLQLNEDSRFKFICQCAVYERSESKKYNGNRLRNKLISLLKPLFIPYTGYMYSSAIWPVTPKKSLVSRHYIINEVYTIPFRHFGVDFVLYVMVDDKLKNGKERYTVKLVNNPSQVKCTMNKAFLDGRYLGDELLTVMFYNAYSDEDTLKILSQWVRMSGVSFMEQAVEEVPYARSQYTK